jgi:hypothetical protein
MSFVEEIRKIQKSNHNRVSKKGTIKSYIPFCSYRNLSDAYKILGQSFEGNNLTKKRKTVNIPGDVVWFKCTKCAIRFKVTPNPLHNDMFFNRKT